MVVQHGVVPSEVRYCKSRNISRLDTADFRRALVVLDAGGRWCVDDITCRSRLLYELAVDVKRLHACTP